MTQNLSISFPVDQLASALIEKLSPQLAPKVKSHLPDDQYLTRKEISKKLNISLPTLNAYTKKGILQGYRVGVRVLYKKIEVDQSLIAINYIRK